MQRLLAPFRFLLAPVRPDPFALTLLALAAAGVLVAGFEHARLFHRGYAEVRLVGPLFYLDALGSMVVVLALLADRPRLFALGALSLCVPSLISIAISHSPAGFFGFREGGYDTDAVVIVVAEVVAGVFALIGLVALLREQPGRRAAMGPMRGALTVAVVAVLGVAVLGIGMGEAIAAHEPAPSKAEVAAARRRVASAAADVRRGRDAFAAQGCDRCHAMAPTGAGGRLGPRLDTLDKSLDDVVESISEPRAHIADGYPATLMRADYGTRLPSAEVQALAAFVTTVSGGEQEGGGSGRGRGRGRGSGGGG